MCAQRCESSSYDGLVRLQCLLVPVYVRNRDLETPGPVRMVTLGFLYDQRFPRNVNFFVLLHPDIIGTAAQLQPWFSNCMVPKILWETC